MTSARDQNPIGWVPLAITAVALLLLILLWKILYVFVLAALVSFVVHPVIQLLNRKLFPVFSIISVFLFMIILFTLLIGLLAPVVLRQSQEFIVSLPSLTTKALDIANGISARMPAEWRGFADRTLTQTGQALVRLAQGTIPALITAFGSLFTLILVPLLSFFMLLHYTAYKQMILAVVPHRHREEVNDLLFCMGKSLWNFFKGELSLMLIIGTAEAIGLSIIGMPYAILFGILGGLLEAIPSVGPALTTTAITLIGLLINPALGIKAAGVTIGVQLLENAFLAPWILSKAVGLDPITTTFSILLGAAMAGVLGAVIAIPVAITIKIVILYFYAVDDDLPEQQQTCFPNRRRRSPRIE